MDSKSKRRNKLDQFLARLTSGKPVEYYAQHIKNLAIRDYIPQNEEIINRILAICSGIENLQVELLTSASGLDFFENPQASRNLRRLTINLRNFRRRPESMPNFYHSCFANLTHLHLLDDEDEWPTYSGWETLTSLTHLAFACSASREKMKQFIPMLPSVRYVALGYYNSDENYKYADSSINNSPGVIAAWTVRVVLFSRISQYDWERGTRGEGDFWDLVEREVERRLEEGLVD